MNESAHLPAISSRVPSSDSASSYRGADFDFAGAGHRVGHRCSSTTAGGVGVAEHGYEVIGDLWHATYEVISQCPCEAGCPSCIHSPKCGNNNQPLDKEVARMVLEGLLAG